MRILVTGGAGFVGSHVVDAFVEAGHEVATLDNLSTGRRENVNPRATLYEVDLRDAQAVEQALQDFRPQAVSHHAAQASVVISTERPAEDATINVVGSLNLLDAGRRAGVEKWIYASTGGAAYGDPPAEVLPVPETYPPEPLSPYGASKYAVEHYVRLYAHNYGMRYTILRYGNVYGPRQDPLGEAGVLAIFVRRIARGEPCMVFGSGEQTRDFVYVGDVAHANLLALEAGDAEVFNIGTGGETSVLQLVDYLRQAWEPEQVQVEFAPARPGEVFRIVLDVRKAAADLGWRPQRSVPQGVRDYVQWYRQQEHSG